MHFLLTKRDCAIAGDTTYLLMLAEGLIRRGHRVTMAAGRGKLAHKFRQAGANLLRLPPHPLLGPALRWRCRGLDLDAVVCTGRGPARWAAYDLAESLGIPCMSTLQDHIEPHESIDEFRRVEALVTVEQPIAENAVERGVPAEKVLVWPRPVRRQELGPTPLDPFSMLWMGRMSGRKAWSAQTLLDAAPALLEAIPRLTITFVGNGSRQMRLRRAAAKLRTPAIRFEPFTLEPLQRMANASIVLGGGYTCLEALYNGRPAIAAGFGWQGAMTADVVEQGYDLHFGDRVFEPCDPAALTATLQQVCRSLQEEGNASPFQPRPDWFPQDHTLDSQAERMEGLVRRRQNAILAQPAA